MTIALERINPERCPDCDVPMGYEWWLEAALLRHGGYGASRETLVICCLACGFEHSRVIRETSPLGD